jgi:hypothetical protein
MSTSTIPTFKTFDPFMLLRVILNFTPVPQGRTSPVGENLAPGGEICPLGDCSPLRSLSIVEKNGGKKQIISPPGDNFTPRVQNSPLGSKFASRGEVKNMGL